MQPRGRLAAVQLDADRVVAAVACVADARAFERVESLNEPRGQVGLLILSHARLVVAHAEPDDVVRERAQERGVVSNERVEVIGSLDMLLACHALARAARVGSTAHRAEQVADINDARASTLRLLQVFALLLVIAVRVVVVRVAAQQELDRVVRVRQFAVDADDALVDLRPRQVMREPSRRRTRLSGCCLCLCRFCFRHDRR